MGASIIVAPPSAHRQARRRLLWGITILLAVFAALLMAADARAMLEIAAPTGAAARCAALRTHDLSTLEDAPSQIVDSHIGRAASGGPDFCVVDGYVASRVGFRLFLPEAGWNGKFLQVGSGGHAGFLTDETCAPGLAKSYACLITDMGHKGTGLDSQWARGDLQARVDWGYRATHVATIAAKAIIAAHYGKPPRRSYFSGCSTGGRQALQEAQKFPWDYDGVIAGAPPIRLADLYVTFAWGALANRDAAGKMILGRDDLDLLARSALAECDLDDGVKDGLISRPGHCGFQPSRLLCRPGQSTHCLSTAQVETARKIYAGPADYKGGALPGTERLWARYYLDGDKGELPYMFALTRNGLGDLFPDPARPQDWTIGQFDFARDQKRLDVMQTLYDSSNPDLSRFAAAGGKAILYIGLGDVSMPNTVIDYFEKVERVAGGAGPASTFARLFLLPGVDHCTGGPGADQVDYLQYLDDWVDKASPPDVLIATHFEPTVEGGAAARRATFSRPVYPYPAYAKYRGRGDPASAASFTRAMPERQADRRR